MTTPLLKIQWDVLENLVSTIGCLPAESGGALGGDEHRASEITQFHFDSTGKNSAGTYTPDYQLLNRLFKTDWNPNGIRLRGFVHSHPGYFGHPSYGDTVYAERILKAIDDLGCLWLPIINTVPDSGMFRLTPWVAVLTRHGVEVQKGQVELFNLPDSPTVFVKGLQIRCSAIADGPTEEIIFEKQINNIIPPRVTANTVKDTQKNLPVKKAPTPPCDLRKTFNRVQSTYYLSLMHRSRIIAVGVGGAAEWLEAMARTGVGQFVMIDPDTVSETNLATQQAYRKDIGRPKVDCIAERILDINPTARVIALQSSLDDIGDKEIQTS